MNKSKELAIMQMKAKIKAEELVKQHNQAWYEEVVEEEEDGS